jgi:steroid delta-isomerase-like uncharacterized protein
MAEGVELIQRFYDDCLGAGDMDAFEEIVSDEVVDHEEFPGAPDNGKEGVRFFVNSMRDAFSDLKCTVSESVESGDRASALITISGKHTGEFMGVPASDRSFEVQCMDIIRFEDGKCLEHWGVTDVMSLMQQLGAIPEPAQA